MVNYHFSPEATPKFTKGQGRNWQMQRQFKSQEFSSSLFLFPSYSHHIYVRNCFYPEGNPPNFPKVWEWRNNTFPSWNQSFDTYPKTKQVFLIGSFKEQLAHSGKQWKSFPLERVLHFICLYAKNIEVAKLSTDNTTASTTLTLLLACVHYDTVFNSLEW